MKVLSILLALTCIVCVASAFSAKAPRPVNPLVELQKGGLNIFAALTIASSTLLTPPPADAILPAFTGTSIVVADKEIREGLYGEYEVEVKPQQVDDARSTFKPASETKSNKGKYTALLAILIVGSFIIPMAQYFWYVRDDDSSDKFFAQNVPPPKEPPKKKGWFN